MNEKIGGNQLNHQKRTRYDPNDHVATFVAQCVHAMLSMHTMHGVWGVLYCIVSEGPSFLPSFKCEA
jgi:hypothetical protein